MSRISDLIITKYFQSFEKGRFGDLSRIGEGTIY